MAHKTIPPHRYTDPGATEPADYAGRRVCGACGLLGKPGDRRHPKTGRPLGEALAEQAEAKTRPRAPRRASAADKSRTAAILAAGRDRDAAILGERDQ